MGNAGGIPVEAHGRGRRWSNPGHARLFAPGNTVCVRLFLKGMSGGRGARHCPAGFMLWGWQSLAGYPFAAFLNVCRDFLGPIKGNGSQV
jgi:hypothetical protein